MLAGWNAGGLERDVSLTCGGLGQFCLLTASFSVT